MRVSKLVSSFFSNSCSRHDHSPPRRPRPPSHPLEQDNRQLRDDDWPVDEEVDALSFEPHRRRVRNRRRPDDISFANAQAPRRRPNRHDPAMLDNVAEWPTRPILHMKPRHDQRHDHGRRTDDIHFYRHPDKDDAPPSRRLDALRTRHVRVKSNLEHLHRTNTSRHSSTDAPVSDSSSSLCRLISAAMRPHRASPRSYSKEDFPSPASNMHVAGSVNEPDAVVGHSGWSDKAEKESAAHFSTKDAAASKRQHFPTGRRIRSNIDHIMNRNSNAQHRSNIPNPANETPSAPVKQPQLPPHRIMTPRAMSVSTPSSEPLSLSHAPATHAAQRHIARPPRSANDSKKLRKPSRQSARYSGRVQSCAETSASVPVRATGTATATASTPATTSITAKPPVSVSVPIDVGKKVCQPVEDNRSILRAVKGPNRAVTPFLEDNKPGIHVLPAFASVPVPPLRKAVVRTPSPAAGTSVNRMCIAPAELTPVSFEEVSTSSESLPAGVPLMPPHAVFQPLSPPPGVPQMPSSVFDPTVVPPAGVPRMPSFAMTRMSSNNPPVALPLGMRPSDVPRPFVPVDNKRMIRLRPPSLDFGPDVRPGFAFGILPDSERKRQLELANIIERPRAGVKESAVRQRAVADAEMRSARQREEQRRSSPVVKKEVLPSSENVTADSVRQGGELTAGKSTGSKESERASRNEGSNGSISTDADADVVDEPRAYAKTQSSIWLAAAHSEDGADGEADGALLEESDSDSESEGSDDHEGRGRRQNERLDEDEDLYAIESISQASFEVTETTSRMRARHGIALLDDISPSGNMQAHVFGRETAFEDEGITINSNGRVELQGKLTRKMSDGTCDESNVPSSGNLIFIRHLSEFQKKFDNLRARKMVKTWRPTLGRGAAGKVYLAVHEPSGRKLAVKEINIFDHDRREQMKKELVTLSSLQSRFLVRYFGAFYDGDGGVHVALEYMDRGSLCDVVAQQGKVPEPVLRTIMEHCLRGLKFLHSNHVLHRDVKTANILLSRRHSRAKLSDFGLALNLRNEKLEAMKDGYREEDCDSIARTFIGTVLFMAPERLTSKEYSYASDIWGLGLCALECALGEYPFPPAAGFFDVLQFTKNVSSYVKTAPVSDELKEFLTLVTKVLPSERPTAAKLLEHPWIKQCMHDTGSLTEWLDALPRLKCQEVAITSVPVDQNCPSRTVKTPVAE